MLGDDHDKEFGEGGMGEILAIYEISVGMPGENKIQGKVG